MATSFSSLNNFTVPLSAGNQNQGMLMPKLAYRFRVTLTGFGSSTFGAGGNPATELTKQVISVERPAPEFEEIKMDIYNSTVKIAGKHKFNDIMLKVRDDVSNNVTNLIGQQLQKQFDFYNQSSAVSGQDYKFFMGIELLDGGNGDFTPNVLEVYQLQGCWIKKASYSGNDYSKGTESMEIDLSICFDNAYQTDVNGNLLPAAQPVIPSNYTGAL
jgi:hypothetical protein